MWLRHHSFFRGLTAIDRPLALLNLLYLGFVAFVPFPTGLIAEQGDETAAVVVYAATIGLTAAIASATVIYAERNALIEGEPGTESLLSRFAVPAVFFLSIPVAFVSADLAMYSWLSLIVVGRLQDRRARAAE
jgi:uncharacterized membrane protein